MAASNNQAFTYATAMLLNALSTWDGADGGFTLEVTAHSPSDEKFHRGVFDFYDGYSFRLQGGESHPGMVEYYKRKESERRASGVRRRTRAVKRGMARRLRGTPLAIQPDLINTTPDCRSIEQSLPNVPIVKGLILRHEFFRGVAPASLARLFRESFVALEVFRLERWEACSARSEREF